MSNSDETLWPPELDAMVASPEHHSVLFENERLRVLDIHIAPGERTAVHTHRLSGVLYVISWSDFLRYDAEGNVIVDSRTVEALNPPAPVLWANPLPPHSLENIGSTDLHLIGVELKDSPLL
jgi:mannose-6-phosphate isomerase-like protein (cupin superfamily)